MHTFILVFLCIIEWHEHIRCYIECPNRVKCDVYCVFGVLQLLRLNLGVLVCYKPFQTNLIVVCKYGRVTFDLNKVRMG